MLAKMCQYRINILREECHEFFDTINKLLRTCKVSNEDKIKLNVIEYDGKEWLLSFQKQNQSIKNTLKFQEEIDIELYYLFDELNLIKNRLLKINNKYENLKDI